MFMTLFFKLLKLTRKFYRNVGKGPSDSQAKQIEHSPQNVSEIVTRAIQNGHPLLVSRLGAFEAAVLANYVGIKGEKKIFQYIKGEQPEWYWNENLLQRFYFNAGFFPSDKRKVEEYCEKTLHEISKIDILIAWQKSERFLEQHFGNVKRINLIAFDPFWVKTPWTSMLKGKKVLVIHPFEDTIRSQYKKREMLFENPLILPDFELITIKAIQSAGGSKTPYQDWFEALNVMKREIDKIDFDICLIGAGAYGFNLGAYVKDLGKQAIHMGGSLQLLFGIRGKRWEDYPPTKRDNKTIDYSKLFNEYWVRPSELEKPKEGKQIEGGCYW